MTNVKVSYDTAGNTLIMSFGEMIYQRKNLIPCQFNQ
jgi:hypothetical protein